MMSQSGPSQRTVGNTTMRVRVKAAEHAAAQRERERLQELGRTAHRLRRPGQPLHEAVAAVGNEIAEALADVGSSLQRQRERARVSFATPSALLQRAQRDWPEQDRAVRALAAETGISLAEAWQQVIAVGVRAIRESEDSRG